jgi:hypothetical protein
MKIIGVADKAGDYQGNDYHNIVFHCSELFQTDKGTGLRTESIKVKYAVLAEKLGKQLTAKELAAFVGQEANFYYDKFNNISLVEFLPKESAAK